MRNLKIVTRVITMLGVGFCALVSFSSKAQAAHTEYGVGYDGIFTNNIYRSPTDKQREYINTVRGLFSYQKHSRRIDTHWDLEAIGRQFTYGTYSNDVLFGLNSRTRIVVLPKVFSLSERDIFTQAPIDPRFVMTPTNLQNTNAFSAGPNFAWYVEPTDAFKVDLRYRNFYYQKVPSTFPVTYSTSNYRFVAETRFVHAFSRHTKASVNYVPSEVFYQNTTVNPDYRRQDVYLGLATHLANAGLTAQGGETRIEQDGHAGTLNGTLAALTLTDNLGPRSRVILAASRRYGDAGRYALLEAPAQNLVVPVATNPAQIVGGGLYYGRMASLGYEYRRPYGTDRINAFWQNLHYLTATLSQQLEGGVANIGYDFSDRFSDSVFGDYVRVHYINYNVDTRDFGGGMRLRYRLSPRLSVSLEGMYDQGVSTDPVLAYKEWRAIIGVSYFTNPNRMRSNPFVHYTNAVFY
ncbi:MAG: porin family protein [Acidiferrobacter sp.]